MKYLVWLLRAAIFFLLFAFSLNNQHDIVVHWFFGAQWHGSLVLAILVAFGCGILVGVGGLLPALLRSKRAKKMADNVSQTPVQKNSADYRTTQFPERE